MSKLPIPANGAKVLFWKNYPLSRDPMIGLVTLNGQNAQNICVLTPTGHKFYSGVHWLRDPDLPNCVDWWNQGVWDVHPDDAKVDKLERVVQELVDKVNAILTTTVPTPPLPEKKEVSEEVRLKRIENMAKARAAKELKKAAA